MKSAFFTGHRKLTGDITNLSERLYNFVERGIINLELTDFYTGGAIGWDTLAAQTILRLREVYPQIKLHLVLPCSNEEQTAKWTVAQKNEFYRILNLADSVEYTSLHYYKGCMKVRNAQLVQYANTRCYCFLNTNNFHSGTAQTVRMALKKHIMVVNFIYKRVDKSGESGIIKNMNRKEKNNGIFETLEIPMQKRNVLSICKTYTIDTKGITFKIQRAEKLLALPFYGSTDYNNIGRIDLFPNAFSSEEELIKTIIHEKCHVKQLQKHGKEYVQNNLDEMEKQAYRFESIYYNIIKKRK